MLDLLKLLLSLCRPARILRWAVFVLVMVVLWITVERPTLEDLFKARERRNDYHDQVERLQQQQQRYQKDLADLKAGGFSLEKAVREQCPLLKPGEKIIFIDPPSTPAAPRPAPAPLASVNAIDSVTPVESAVEAPASAKPAPTPGGNAAKKSVKNESKTKSTAKSAAGTAKAAKKTLTRKSAPKSVD